MRNFQAFLFCEDVLVSGFTKKTVFGMATYKNIWKKLICFETFKLLSNTIEFYFSRA